MIEFISQQYFFAWNDEFLDAATEIPLFCEMDEPLSEH